jgi:hypothetical protein
MQYHWARFLRLDLGFLVDISFMDLLIAAIFWQLLKLIVEGYGRVDWF